MAKPTLVSETQTASAEPADLFDDLSKFRLSQDFERSAGVKKLLTKIPVLQRPNPQTFFRIHPDPAYRGAFAVINLKDEREFYLLSTNVAESLPGEYQMVLIYAGITRQGTVFLWPVPLPGSDGKINEWHRSAHQCAELAMTRWIRMRADQELRGYATWESDKIEPPKWPENLSFAEMLRLGFGRGFVITDLDHPVVQRLRGL
jgi:hypothetical protein